MQILFLSILLLLSLAVYFIIIQPLVPLLILKLKLGDKAIIKFYPIFGFVGVFMNSIKTNNDKQSKSKDHSIEFSKQTLYNRLQQEIFLLQLRIYPNPMLSFYNIMLAGTEYLKQTYQEHDDFEKIDPFMLPSFMQKGLGMSEGESWKRQRKFLGPSFTFEKLRSRLPMMNQVVQDIAEKDDTIQLKIF